jgi:Peptidase family S41
MRLLTLVTLFVSLLGSSLCLAAESSLAEILDFELGPSEGIPSGWLRGSPGATHVDSLVVHNGDFSCRLQRDYESDNSFSTLMHSIPVQRQGKVLTLKGFLKTEDVTEYAGLWLRLDSDEGTAGFDNMRNQDLNGTNDWAEFTIEMPFNSVAHTIVFGALIVGEGKLWIDDLQMLVDGVPYDNAPVLVKEITILDTDKEFAAGSGIDVISLTDVQVRNMVLLGKVWGFLKYHHPAIRNGQRHWDFDLFRVLPDVLAAADTPEAAGKMVDWIGALGEVPECDPCVELGSELAARPRLDWLADEAGLGSDLSRSLQHIYRNRPVDQDQFYVALMPQVGNPQFKREKTYQNLCFQDTGYRILALFRYWNAIEYWFPNRDLIDRNWDEVLTVYLPEIVAATDEIAYKLNFLKLIAEVKDGHANLYSANQIRPPEGTCRLPVVIRFIENQAVVTAFADAVRGPETGLEVGDVITRIDGNPVSELIELWAPFYPASNQAHRLRTMARNLTRGSWGHCEVDVERDGKQVSLKAMRLPPKDQEMMVGWTHDLPGETFQLLGEDVAYLKLSSVALPETPGYVENAAGTKGLIIDIRNYPSAFMVFALGSRLVSETIPFVCFTRGDLLNPGSFLWVKELSLSPMTPGYDGQVVLLVDESSMSQAEYTAMALRVSPGTVVVGSTTAGADGNISQIKLPGGLTTNISGIGVFYPDRSPTQRVGIVPDVEVLPTVAGIREGRDEVLEEALRQILGDDLTEQDAYDRYRQHGQWNK